MNRRRAGQVRGTREAGTDALDRLAVTRYEVVILDRDLPGVHGDVTCRRLAHDRCETRVLVLAAAGTIEDRVDGLSLGADDYLPKPFAFAELVARPFLVPSRLRWHGQLVRRKSVTSGSL